MPFKSDSEIESLVNTQNSLAPDCRSSQAGVRDARIKAGSLDLTIGAIFIPGSEKGKLGSAENPRENVSLQQGATAIVRTCETLNVPDNFGGIAFPPARLSLKGLLTTNPGHLDPGYSGHLHLTLINMGEQPISLSKGDRVVRVLFYEMTQAASNPFRSSPEYSPINEELLHSLSHDFLGIDKRTARVAKEEVNRAQRLLTFWTPLAAALFAAAIPSITALVVSSQTSSLESRLDKLEGRIGGLGGDVNLDSVDKRIKELEKRVK